GTDLAQWMRLMGQDLFNPPSVKGWKGGKSWLNSFTYLIRFNFVQDAVGRRDLLTLDRIVDDLSASGLATGPEIADAYLSALGPLRPSDGERRALIDYLSTGDDQQKVPFHLSYGTADRKIRGLLQLITSLPSYHMS